MGVPGISPATMFFATGMHRTPRRGGGGRYPVDNFELEIYIGLLSILFLPIAMIGLFFAAMWLWPPPPPPPPIETTVKVAFVEFQRTSSPSKYRDKVYVHVDSETRFWRDFKRRDGDPKFEVGKTYKFTHRPNSRYIMDWKLVE